MIHRVRVSLGAAGCILTSACIGSAPPEAGAGTGSPTPAASVGSAVVLGEQQLWERGGNLLSLISSRVTSMRVRRSGPCPEIVMRGRKSVIGPTDPGVYVDGARAGNTCILDLIQPDDVSRVEVYPMGVTQRPGYRSNSNGLILIFTRHAAGAQAPGSGGPE
jgi:hypothetical protein